MAERFIDTHIHIWNFDRATYPWLEGNTSILNRTYHIRELEAERKKAGVTDGVLVQAANNIEDTDWMLEVAGKTSWIKGVVGWIPLLQPAEASKIMSGKYMKDPYFKGVRHLIHDEPDAAWLLQEPVLESLNLLASNYLPYDLVGILPQHLETALAVAAKVPDLKMVFDHLNQPPIATKEHFGRWGILMKEAAKHPNFYVKISGLGTTTQKVGDWSEDDIKPYIEYALEYFGEDRCFCGGDWPVSLLEGSYSRTIKTFRSVLNTLLNKEQQEKVYYKNADTFYKLSLDQIE
jgi:L-fuconolactonase